MLLSFNDGLRPRRKRPSATSRRGSPIRRLPIVCVLARVSSNGLGRRGPESPARFPRDEIRYRGTDQGALDLPRIRFRHLPGRSNGGVAETIAPQNEAETIGPHETISPPAKIAEQDRARYSTTPMPRVALAYSGSLDTTICLYYLRQVRGMKVFTFSANLGQYEQLQPMAEKAMRMGAEAAHIADLRERFVTDYVFPTLRADAVYEGAYHLFSALSRPLIVQELIEIAREEGCDHIAHGSRGVGNDAIRIGNALAALAKDLRPIAPLKELGLEDPKQDVEYARAHQIPVEEERKALFNIEQNLWGVNIQVRSPEGIWAEPPPESYILTTALQEVPSKPAVVEVEFEAGTPVRLNGELLSPVDLVSRASQLAGRHGVGRIDTIESRITGLKTREIYEAPAAVLLYKARRALAQATVDRGTLHALPVLSARYADLVYEGKWFSPLREALDAFFSVVNRRVTGKVKLTLYRGSVTVSEIDAPGSLVQPRGW